MSSNILSRVALILIIVFGGTLLIIYIMFEALGIAELVWPILFPIYAGIFGIVVFVIVILGIACKAGGGIPSDQTMVRRVYQQPTYPNYDDLSVGAVYVVPLYCPHCKSKLELDKVEWFGSTEFACPSCFSVVQASVRENF